VSRSRRLQQGARHHQAAAGRLHRARPAQPAAGRAQRRGLPPQRPRHHRGPDRPGRTLHGGFVSINAAKGDPDLGALVYVADFAPRRVTPSVASPPWTPAAASSTSQPGDPAASRRGRVAV